MRFRNHWIRFFFVRSALLVAALMLGCGGGVTTPDEQAPSEFAGAPEWVLSGCNAYWDGDDGARLCGVGNARFTGNMSITRQKATARARAEISRSLETKVKSMVKDFQEDVTDGGSEMTAEQFSTTTISLSKATLNGTQQIDQWLSPSDELWMLVALDVTAFENSVSDMTEMDERLRSYIQSRARASFEELDEEMGEY